MSLNSFLKKIADAIRTKKQTTASIPAQNFEAEILSIVPIYDDKEIKSNGTHDVVDYKNVIVEVPGYEELVTMIEGSFGQTFNIPEGVTAIKGNCFKNAKTLLSITIPEGVTSIGEYAFGDCENLQSITIPKGVTSIGEYAFVTCRSLKEITIPEGVTSIGSRAFNNCSEAISIIIPEGVTSIGGAAFSQCSKLKEIIIPDSVKTIGDSILSYCNALEKIVLPNLESMMLKYQPNDSEKPHVYVKMTLTEYMGKDHRNKYRITAENQGINHIYFLNDDNEFEEVVDVIIPEGTTELKQYIFQSFEGIKSISLPSGLLTIGDYALRNCEGLTELVIPSTVTTIAYYSLVIGSSTNKATIIMESSTPPQLQTTNAIDKNRLNKIYVPFGSRSTYISTTNWSSFADYIIEPNTVLLSVPSGILNNDNYVYSIDQGETWNQFSSASMTLNEIATIRFKNLATEETLLIGTTAGGSDIGTIANAELNYNVVGNTTIHITLQ